MDHERQLGFARSSDVAAKALLLRGPWTLVVEIVEAGFADGDYFGMAAQPYDLVHRHIQLFMGVVRMRADGTEDIGVRIGNLQQPVEAADAGGDGDHQPDAGRLGPGNDAVELIGKVREVEMAMVVDERHGAMGIRPFSTQ